MENIPMKYIIFGNTINQARDFLHNILLDIPKENILKHNESPNSARVLLNNGTVYEIALNSDSSRMRRCDIAYVNSNVQKDILDNVIKACLTPSTIDDLNRIIYY